jgi:hypothetical protein
VAQRANLQAFRCCPNLNVAPPSWRLNAGWKPALHLKLGQHRLFVLLATFSAMGWGGQLHCRIAFPAGPDR